MSFATSCICLELRPLPSTRVTRFPRLSDPRRKILALQGASRAAWLLRGCDGWTRRQAVGSGRGRNFPIRRLTATSPPTSSAAVFWPNAACFGISANKKASGHIDRGNIVIGDHPAALRVIHARHNAAFSISICSASAARSSKCRMISTMRSACRCFDGIALRESLDVGVHVDAEPSPGRRLSVPEKRQRDARRFRPACRRDRREALEPIYQQGFRLVPAVLPLTLASCQAGLRAGRQACLDGSGSRAAFSMTAVRAVVTRSPGPGGFPGLATSDRPISHCEPFGHDTMTRVPA